MREIDVNLGAGSARTGVGHLPEVVGGTETINARVGELGDLLPQFAGLVVFVEYADPEVLLRNPQLVRDELPRESNGVALEVVAEREIAEHLEKRVMPGRMADLFEVVVLAARAHAFLAGRGTAISLGRRLVPEKDLLELDHPRVREKQGGIVPRNERRTGPDGVVLAREVVEEAASDLGSLHIHEI